MAEDIFNYCAALLRKHDADRYLTVAVRAGRERREALFALYAFNLEIARVREAVREPIMGHDPSAMVARRTGGDRPGSSPRT